jgi:endoglucanase
MNLRRLLTALCLVVFLPKHMGVAQESTASFIVHGDFAATQENGLPVGWQRRGEEGEGIILRQQEGDVPFIRFSAQQPDQLVGIVQSIPIPPGVLGLEFYARFRTANVKFGKSFLCDARARFGFYDADGNPVKGAGDVIFDSHARDWTDISRSFAVPAGAVSVNLMLCLNRPAAGTLDVREVRLSAMDAQAAQELVQKPLLAAKKKAEDEAAIQALVARPPVTRMLRVRGNALVNEEGAVVLLQGVNVPSLEWSPKGENIQRSMKVALLDWKANVVRLPVSASFWFGRGKGSASSNDLQVYRAIVDDAVKMAAGQGAYLILDLHSYGGIKPFAIEFWTDAAARYANHPAVLFDLWNEPHGISWELWQNGGEKQVIDKKTKTTNSVQLVGMQNLVDTVRATGAKNIIVAGGINYALDLRGILDGHALRDPGGQGIVYATHFYNWHGNWASNFLAVAERYPLLVGEFGADVKKMNFVPASTSRKIP